MGPYQGKQTSELALLRQIVGQFEPGDIVLADRFFCSYWVIAALQAPRASTWCSGCTSAARPTSAAGVGWAGATTS